MTTTLRKWITDPALIAKCNRGPITSAFVPPTSCTATLSLFGGTGGVASILYFGHFRSRYNDPSCYPLGTLSPSDIYSSSAWNRYYYSPAICPLDWNTTTFTGTFPAYGQTNEISIGPSTTAALCCPKGYVYKWRGHVCVSNIAKGQVVTYVSASDHGLSWERGTTIISTFEEASTVVGYGVPIFWQASDELVRSAASTMLSTSTASASAGPSSTPSFLSASARPSSTTPFPSPTSSPALDFTPETSVGGLTTGAQVAIGVGVSITCIVAVALGVYFFLRHRVHTDTMRQKLDVDANIESRRAHEIYTAPQELPGNLTDMYMNRGVYELRGETSEIKASIETA